MTMENSKQSISSPVNDNTIRNEVIITNKSNESSPEVNNNSNSSYQTPSQTKTDIINEVEDNTTTTTTTTTTISIDNNNTTTNNNDSMKNIKNNNVISNTGNVSQQSKSSSVSPSIHTNRFPSSNNINKATTANTNNSPFRTVCRNRIGTARNHPRNHPIKYIYLNRNHAFFYY